MKCIRLAFPFLLLAACGDNVRDSDAPDAGPPDGPDLRAGKAAIVSGDFNQTGVLSTVEAPSMVVTPNAVAGIASSDPVIRRIGDELFVVNRLVGNNVVILDATTLALVTQIAIGAGTNPQDVAVVGTKLYLPVYNGAGVAVVDRAHPDQVTTIDLGDLDPNDNLPNCSSAYAVGARVFVTCQILDNDGSFAVTGPGKLVVIDSSDDTVETTIDLATVNPQGFLIPVGSDLYTQGNNYLDPTAGCLARITTGATPTSECVIENQDTTGYVNHIARIGDDVFATINWYDTEAPYAAHGTLHRVDVSAKTLGPSLLETDDVPRDLAACGEYLFVSDKAADVEGIRVFHAAGGDFSEETSAALQIGLPPLIGDGIACMNVPL